MADPSAYALCFAIFGLRLLGDATTIAAHRDTWDKHLRQAVRERRLACAGAVPLSRDKPYLQLLTFTLSALSVLGTLSSDPLRDDVLAVLPHDIGAELDAAGSLRGVARSGNHAMFLGILLLHARDHLGMDSRAQIRRWVDLHLAHMNRFGFWGDSRSMSHLQFQNGYHQYELFEYLEVENPRWPAAADSVASLADAQGNFAPYPGGGGCYDYDAVLILTGAGAEVTAKHAKLLRRTAETIASEQNSDGGFCESRYVRPRSIANLRRTWAHIAAASGRARQERLRQGLTLLRPRHDRLQTHWSHYSRRWDESDLWDSWFRMLTLARIEVAFDPSKAVRWGFINYPGIGFHPLARDRRAL